MKTTKNYRKITLILVMLIFINITGYSQKAYFLHHSTGNGVYSQGNVANKINEYNTDKGKNYILDHKYYPNKPYGWENYPYDYWNLWINGNCDNSKPNIECLESMLERYDIIVFKHCFPGADILEDIATPSVSSKVKCLANYKLQYRALRDKMATYPSKHFVVWTLAPRHRLYNPSQSAVRAARAREFVNWVKNDWLTEDGKDHSNIHIFDFYNIVAESNPTPANGKVNCLKYDYEKSHTDRDSHPNQQANIEAGQQFADFMIEVFKEVDSTTTDIKTENSNSKEDIIYNENSKTLFIKSLNKEKNRVSILDIMGREYISLEFSGTEKVNVSQLNKGIYIVRQTNGTGKGFTKKILVK